MTRETLDLVIPEYNLLKQIQKADYNQSLIQFPI